jgi:hypothetical protein
VKLSSQMIDALRRLANADAGIDWVQMYTGRALVKRGLAEFVGVVINPSTRQTTAGTFPSHQMKLTAAGQSWCRDHVAPNVSRPATP